MRLLVLEDIIVVWVGIYQGFQGNLCSLKKAD